MLSTGWTGLKSDGELDKSDIESQDLLFKSIEFPTLDETGILIPVKCGHRGIIKENTKERWALDHLLEEAGFKSNVGCVKISSPNRIP